jgi:hypothetical protein
METQDQVMPQAPMGADVRPDESSFMEKLQLLFSSPTRLFESLKLKSSWLAPLILLFLITFIASMIAQPYIMPSVREDVMTLLQSNPDIPESAVQQAEESFANAEKRDAKSIVLAFVGAAFMRALFFFVVVTVIFLIGTIIFGGTAKYGKVMSMYAWALPIWALGLVIVTPLMIIKGSHAVSLSPALLMPPDPLNPIYFLLNNFSLFNIWAVIVLGIGFSVMYGVSRAKGIITMIVIWSVWIAINSFVPFLNFQAWITGLT